MHLSNMAGNSHQCSVIPFDCLFLFIFVIVTCSIFDNEFVSATTIIRSYS